MNQCEELINEYKITEWSNYKMIFIPLLGVSTISLFFWKFWLSKKLHHKNYDWQSCTKIQSTYEGTSRNQHCRLPLTKKDGKFYAVLSFKSRCYLAFFKCIHHFPMTFFVVNSLSNILMQDEFSIAEKLTFTIATTAIPMFFTVINTLVRY